MTKALLIAAAFIVLAPLALLTGMTTAASETSQSLVKGGSADSVDIPSDLVGLYEQAASRFDIAAPLLEAIGKVECDHDRDPRCGAPNAAGAIGPMQFLPATFARYASASGSPVPEITNETDAVYAAAAKLAADGIDNDPVGAIYSWNHDNSYVARVISYAVAYGWSPDHGVAVWTIAHDANLLLSNDAMADVMSGAASDRVLVVLAVVSTRFRLSGVGPIRTGHDLLVAGTDHLSNHAAGRAVDIPVVDGEVVSSANQSAHALVEWLSSFQGSLRPSEIGAPWSVDEPDIRSFTEGHNDHVHIGFDQ